MATHGSVDISMLLQHDALLRRLAVRLAEPSDGEDALQETWLAALKQGGLLPGTAGAWLGVTLKRFIAGGRRSGARVKRREAAVARRDVVPSASEIVERESARREVVAALLALDPIYRDALVLRYESDLPPRKVAAALGIPVETARTRIKRGLVMMRRQLDDEVGPDRRKALALLLARPGTPAVGLAALGIVAAGIVLTIVGVTTWVTLEHPGASSREQAARVSSAAPPPPASAAVRAQSSSSDALVVLDEREASELYPCAEPRDADGAHRFVATRVIDELTGAPVAGARVGLIDESESSKPPVFLAETTSDADGWVRFGVEDHRGRRLGVFWSAEGFTAGAASGVVPPFPILLQRSAERAFRVLDVAGTPIPGATVGWRVGAPRLVAGADATTGIDGLAHIRGLDPASGCVVASHPGHVTAKLALAAPEPGAAPSEIVLLPARRCEGVVVLGGVPVAGAIVGGLAPFDPPAISDADGRVEIHAAVAGAPLDVTVSDSDVVTIFSGPPAGRRFRLELRPQATKAVRFACVGADGARVAAVPLCVVSAAGDVTRASGDATGMVAIGLSEGSYDVMTDDLSSATEVVPARVTVGAGAAGSDVALNVVARPRALVEIARDLSPAARVLLVTDDASIDVTGPVWAGESIPVPLEGSVRVVIADGPEREARSLSDSRSPGSVSFARFEATARPARAAGVPLFIVAVRDRFDAPVPGARVVVEGAPGTLAGVTDARGDARFEASAVKAGGAIAVRSEGLAPAFGRVESQDVARISWPGTALDVVVKGPDPAGMPPPVVIVDGEPVYLERGTGAVAGLAAGEHVAVVAAAGWISKVVRFELTGAADAVLEVVLRPQPK